MIGEKIDWPIKFERSVIANLLNALYRASEGQFLFGALGACYNVFYKRAHEAAHAGPAHIGVFSSVFFIRQKRVRNLPL